MLRSLSILAAMSLSAPVLAQGQNIPAMPAECLVRVNAAPASWIIQGYDPFGGSSAEGTFGVTFTNDGTADCRFMPTFELQQPPFGLSDGKSKGKRIGYAVLNLTDTQDVTPRGGRTNRFASNREMVLKPNESRSLLFKLVTDPDDVRDAGTFTQDVTLEAQGRDFKSFGGTPLVLGMTVLPSARIGLSGAYSMNDGQAVVDLGELRKGVAPVPLHLKVSSTGEYDISVSSANSGVLRLGSSQWVVPYTMAIGGNSVNLGGAKTVTGSSNTGARRDSLPIQFVIGDVSDRRAGTYSDVVSISVTAR